MPSVEHKKFTQNLIEFFESNPDMFVRCDRDGKENPHGEYWRVRGNGTTFFVPLPHARDDNR